MDNNKVLISVIVNVVAVVLPLIGIQIGSDKLMEVAQIVTTIITGTVVYFEHKKVSAIAGSIRR